MRKILLLSMSLVLAILLYELFLKFSPFKYGISPVVYDEKIGMWHKRNFSDYHIKSCYKTKYFLDNDGLQKSIYPYEKTKKDVIIIGDSYTEAFMVKNENILHNALAIEYQNSYNFLNYSLSGTSPLQHFIILQEKVNLSNTAYMLQFINEGDLQDADINSRDELSRPKVFVEFNDFENYKIIYPNKQTIYNKIVDFMGNFELYSYIKKALYFIKNLATKKDDKTIINSTENRKENLSKNWLHLNGSIYQTKKLLSRYDIKYKILLDFVDNNKAHIIETFLEKQNIDFINLRKTNGLKLVGFDCDAHWSDQTHIDIAKMIKESGFIK